MSNVDYAEIEKFKRLSSEWWDPEGQCKPLHDINPLRLSFIQQHAILKNKNILDIGCGGGILTESMAKLNANVTGIDASDAVLQVAQLHAETSKLPIRYELETAESMGEKHSETFDVITCMELLEHVPDPSSLINACAKLAKSGGALFFSTINRNIKSFLSAIIGAEYVLKLLPAGTHDYAKFIRPSELDTWAKKANLAIKAIQGMTYHPLKKTYRLTKDVSVNYLVYCIKL